MDRRWSFDTNAERYHAWRPGYPEPLYQILENVCGLAPGSKVLEIGPGTGQATRELLARGAEVLAVELGARLAARLRHELGGFSGLTVIEDDVESVRLPPATFDLAICATALHWMNAATTLPRIAAALRPGGWLAVWWTVFGDPARTTPFRARLNPMLCARFPAEPDGSRPRPMEAAARIAELTAGGWFARVETEQLLWTPRFTPVELAGLFSTFPHIAELPAADRDAVLDDIADLAAQHTEADGKLTENYVIAIYLARRTALAPRTAVPRTRPRPRPAGPPRRRRSCSPAAIRPRE